MKKKLIPLFIAVFFILAGCQKTPTTMPKENTLSEQIEGGTTEAEENMTVVTLTSEEINEVLQIGGKTIYFDGIITKPDKTDGLYTYLAIDTDYDEYYNNMDFLFGEYEKKAYDDELFNHMKHAKGENGYVATINNTRAIEGEAIGMTSVIYFDLHQDTTVSADEIAVNMTDEEAKEKADEIISRIGVEGFEFSKFTHVQAVPGKIFRDMISVIYKQFLQGVPVSFDYEVYKDCEMYVIFSSRGVECVSIMEYDYERLSGNSHCLTYEEALKCFQAYVERWYCYEEAVFDKISFQYVLKEKKVDDKSFLVAIPCWRFDGIFDPSIGQYYPDVFVDATSGEVYCK